MPHASHSIVAVVQKDNENIKFVLDKTELRFVFIVKLNVREAT